MATKLNLIEEFQKNILPNLQKKLGIKNKMAVPRLKKVSINVGIGKYLEGSKDYSQVVKNIQEITGQKPVVTKAKKAISNFKVREGMPVGIMVTLRGRRMYDFINKLVNIVFPRVRDFRGISKKSFDGKGNYSVGLKEYTVFPEINPDDIVKMHGLEISIATTGKNNEEAYTLLKEIGFPFKEAAIEKK
jgi:large subunit ribosomal protein L5